MTTIITRDEAVLGGEPRLEGTRIGVRHVVGMLRGRDLDADEVADELGIDPVDVERCVEYYDTHQRIMTHYERQSESVVESIRAESRAPEA